MTVAQSIGGVQLSKNLSHTIAGFKLDDAASICPNSGRPLFVQSSDSPGLGKSQSRSLCFPLKIAMSRETKELFNCEFCDVFEFLQVVRKMEA